MLARKEPHPHPIPLKWCLKPVNVASPSFLGLCKLGVLQFVLIKPITAAIALVSEALGVYHDGEILNPKGTYLWVTIVNNFAVSTAMYALVLFYLVTKIELSPRRPVPKFLSIKAVIFFSFWQSVVIAFLVKVGVIGQAGSWTSEDVATGLQDWLICVEMFVASLIHILAFSHTPYVLVSGQMTHKTPLLASARNAMSVQDVLVDTRDTIIAPLTSASRSAINRLPIPGRRRATAADPTESDTDNNPIDPDVDVEADVYSDEDLVDADPRGADNDDPPTV